jgi:zinc-ribbon domain
VYLGHPWHVPVDKQPKHVLYRSARKSDRILQELLIFEHPPPAVGARSYKTNRMGGHFAGSAATTRHPAARPAQSSWTGVTPTGIVSRMGCPACGATIHNPEARFCTKCGTELAVRETITSRRARLSHWIALPFLLLGRALYYPIQRHQERIRWLTEASGPSSPINAVPRLSEGAKQVYTYWRV